MPQLIIMVVKDMLSTISVNNNQNNTEYTSIDIFDKCCERINIEALNSNKIYLDRKDMSDDMFNTITIHDIPCSTVVLDDTTGFVINVLNLPNNISCDISNKLFVIDRINGINVIISQLNISNIISAITTADLKLIYKCGNARNKLILSSNAYVSISRTDLVKLDDIDNKQLGLLDSKTVDELTYYSTLNL